LPRRGLDRLDGVAGVDRPLEGVGRDDLDDFGDLHHVEERGDARHHGLAGGGRRRDERVVGAGKADDERGEGSGSWWARESPSARRTFATPARAAAASAAGQSLPATRT
jgi:hypothetical protein